LFSYPEYVCTTYQAMDMGDSGIMKRA